MSEACSNCRFWDVYDRGSAFYDDVAPDSMGDCRRRPPRVSDEVLRRVMPGPSCDQLDRLANDLYLASPFPVTASTSWCGEYEPQRVSA